MYKKSDEAGLGSFPNGDYKAIITYADDIDDNMGKVELNFEVKHHYNTINNVNFWIIENAVSK